MKHLPWSEKTIQTVLQYRRQDLVNGPLDEHFGALLEISPEFGMITDEYLVGDIMSRPGLPMRERSIIIISTLLTNKFALGVLGHMKWALNIGLSREEVLEILYHVGFNAGWPVGSEIVELFEKAYPGYLKTTSDNLIQKVQSNPELSERERTLILMAVSITSKLSSRLREHLLHSLDIGITREEILETIMQVTPFAGWPIGVEALLVAKAIIKIKS